MSSSLLFNLISRHACLSSDSVQVTSAFVCLAAAVSFRNLRTHLMDSSMNPSAPLLSVSNGQPAGREFGQEPQRGLANQGREQHHGETSTSFQQPARQHQGSNSCVPSERPLATAPLSAVVADAVRRWYLDAQKEALRGDVKQQALLGHMLLEGYGCDRDSVAGREWVDRAKRRGYRMSGVYCEL